MTRLLVNSHGGYDASIAPPMFAVPAGVVVNFYCPHDQLLSNDDSWRVLNHRRNFLPGDPAGIIQRNAGTVIPNYYALPYDSLGVNSGIDREIVGPEVVGDRLLRAMAGEVGGHAAGGDAHPPDRWRQR